MVLTGRKVSVGSAFAGLAGYGGTTVWRSHGGEGFGWLMTHDRAA